MSGLRDLYQEVILDHSRAPRNKGHALETTHEAEGFNPLCGDHFFIYVHLDNGSIKKVTFDGSGCAISTASASMMTESLIGKTIGEARELFDSFHGLLTSEEAHVNEELLDKLVIFSGVREFPTRVKCATLAWHTLQAALERQAKAVTTE
jgi:nitrogen fixation protein NifU and related proteins